ncbi:hypothetical protein BWD42_24360 [Sphingobacterium sp. CZ-UAM]|uniref:hypothetical protein n=1 Tax=Sphingobacterium sp. CZ-UAM TaxID=1933868 RepID=UPI00098504B7|nr:hypothetical protein [Sphingobacterium sp. CZ-UAM]OOG15686.1 hypothetical protein BWD42_24360 [Sphingobacterium sp. CZ-UAM]
MKRKLVYTLGLAFLAVAACKRDDYWNQTTVVPRGSISGTLTNTDDNTALKGVKILFERQTKANGEQTFVDTVPTDDKGQFKYAVPYPNKVKVSIRDTGRYQLNETFVELSEQKDYPIALKSFPRFGVSQINVQVLSEDKQPYEGIRIGLYERETSTESYSAVDTLVSDAQGKVSFTGRAFPVRYKVKITEPDIAYSPDSVEGALLTKTAIELSLTTRSLFGKGNLKLMSKQIFSNRVIKNEKLQYRYKSVLDSKFSAWEEGEFGADGQLTLVNKVYPGEVEIKYSANSKVRFEVQNSTMTLSELNTTTPFPVLIKDLEPRYKEPVLTNLKVSTLVLNNGLKVKGPFAITMDNSHNLYIADGYKNQLFMVDAQANASVIAGNGTAGSVDGAGTAAAFNGMWGVAVDSSGVIYTTDAANVAGAHRIRKIVKAPNGDYTVSTIAGTGTAGAADGAGSAATFTRPSGIIFDKARKCLYVSEWGAGRVRKIDLSTTANTVSTLAVPAGASNLFTMTLTPDAEDMYVSSNNNNNIFKYNFTSGTIVPYQNSGVNNRGLFATAGDKLLATSGNNNLIFYYDLKTNTMTELSTRVSSGDETGKVIENVPIKDEAARFFQPFGIYYDVWTGNWYVANNTNKNTENGFGSVRIIRSDDI